MHGATDAARAAADIVLTQPGLSTIVHGILISRCIFVRIRNFLTYRIAGNYTIEQLSPFYKIILNKSNFTTGSILLHRRFRLQAKRLHAFQLAGNECCRNIS